MKLHSYMRDRELIFQLGREIRAIERCIMIAERGDQDGVDETWVQDLKSTKQRMENEKDVAIFRVEEIDVDQDLLTKKEMLDKLQAEMKVMR